MNWLAFAFIAWVCFGLETGLQDALRLGERSVAPSFVVPLVVYVALSAPPRIAAWAAVLLGLAMDLTWSPGVVGGGTAHVVGPYALGFLLATHLVMASRGMVLRQHPFTLAVLSVLAAAVAQVAVVSFLMLHTVVYGDLVWSGTSELAGRMFSAGYTAVAGLLLALPFRFADRIMGFPIDRHGRRFK